MTEQGDNNFKVIGSKSRECSYIPTEKLCGSIKHLIDACKCSKSFLFFHIVRFCCTLALKILYEGSYSLLWVGRMLNAPLVYYSVQCSRYKWKIHHSELDMATSGMSFHLHDALIHETVSSPAKEKQEEYYHAIIAIPPSISRWTGVGSIWRRGVWELGYADKPCLSVHKSTKRK